MHTQTVRYQQENTKFYILKFLQFEAIINFNEAVINFDVYDYIRMTMCATFFHLKSSFYMENPRLKSYMLLII